MNTYRVHLRTGGILASGMSIQFKEQKVEFRGRGGGLAFGFIEAQATATFELPLESMRGWEARFLVEGGGLGGAAGAMQLWAMDGRRIGSVVFGGKGLGLNLVAGQGRFH